MRTFQKFGQIEILPLPPMPHKESPSSSNKKHKKSLKSDTDNPDGEFQVINASLTLSVPPIFADNPRAGVEEMLDSMIMRYLPCTTQKRVAYIELIDSDISLLSRVLCSRTPICHSSTNGR